MALDSLSRLAEYMDRPSLGLPVEEHITLFSPDDNVRDALVTLLRSVSSSLILLGANIKDSDQAAQIWKLEQDDKIYVARTSRNPLIRGMIIDGLDVVSGTALEHASATDQLRHGLGELTVIRHPVVAARWRHKFDLFGAEHGLYDK